MHNDDTSGIEELSILKETVRFVEDLTVCSLKMIEDDT